MTDALPELPVQTDSPSVGGDTAALVSLYKSVIEQEPHNPTIHYHAGILQLTLGQNDCALALFEQAIKLGIEDPDCFYLAGLALEVQGRLDHAVAHYEKVLTFTPHRVDALLRLADTQRRRGALTEAFYNYKKALLCQPGCPEAINGLQTLSQSIAHDVACAKNPLVTRQDPETLQKAIIFCGIDSSAGVFITNELADGLGIPKRDKIINEISATCTIAYPSLMQHIREGGISHAHLSPRIENLIMLHCSGIKKLVVHVRDPRQIILSSAYWYDKLYQQSTSENDQLNLMLLENNLGANYFNLSFDAKFEVLLERRLPLVLSFIEDWLRVSEDPRWNFKILFTTFEDFKTKREAFYRAILDFYGIPQEKFHLPEQEPTPDTDYFNKKNNLYFRKGSLDEWRRIYSPAQVATINGLIPSYVFERFGWAI